MTEPPLVPSREDAADWAVRELSGPGYAAADPGPWQRIVRWLTELLNRAAEQAIPSSPVASIALGVLALLLIGVVTLLVRRFGFAGTLRSSGRQPVFEGSGTARTATEHRAAAEAAAAGGHWTSAVLERFRAVVRELEERTLLTERPGRTAHEAAVDASRALPGLTRDLTAAAFVFDQLCYGGRDGDRAAYDQVSTLDAAVVAADPRLTGAGGPARR